MKSNTLIHESVISILAYINKFSFGNNKKVSIVVFYVKSKHEFIYDLNTNLLTNTVDQMVFRINKTNNGVIAKLLNQPTYLELTNDNEVTAFDYSTNELYEVKGVENNQISLYNLFKGEEQIMKLNVTSV